jgi:ApeA N-terminal domain 1
VADRTALALSFDPDDYLCTWEISTGEGDHLNLPGSVTVQPNGPPIGLIHGNVPIKWTETETGARSAEFPQIIHRDVVVGHLANGAHAVLADATIEYWFPGQGHLSAASAVLSVAEVPQDRVPAYSRIEFQVHALDAVAGVAPLKSTLWPTGKDTEHLEGTWSAEGNPQSSQEWTDEGVTFRLEYDLSLRSMDPYSYRMGLSPVARIEASQPLTIRQWVEDWVEPTRRLVCIATGETQDLTYLAVRDGVGGEQGWSQRGQVFGSGITQAPYESRQDDVRKRGTSLYLKPDGISLLALVRKWQDLTATRHPLVETYGAMLTARDQHPRSRYLLLIQALEGLHGFETKEAYERRRTKHQEERTTVLAAVHGHLNSKGKRFLQRNLAREPRTSLDDALRGLMKGLPGEPLAKIADSDLIIEAMQDEPVPETTESAMRIIRNNLTHGNRGYEPRHLYDVVKILERVVRAHALRVLEAGPQSVERVLTHDD